MSVDGEIVGSAARPTTARRQWESGLSKRLFFDLLAILAFAALPRLVFFFRSAGE